MALTTLSVRWAPLEFWTPAAEARALPTLGVRWEASTYWRSSLEADTTAPSIEVDVPAGVIAPSQLITVSCSDTGGTFSSVAGIARFTVWVQDVHGGVELAYDVRAVGDEDIGPLFSPAGGVVANGNGFAVDLLYDDGVRNVWPWAGFTIIAVATDHAGNQTRAEFAYSVDPNYETASSTVLTPAAPTTIAYDASVTVEVTETTPDSIDRVRIVARFSALREEVIFDGIPSDPAASGYSVVQGPIAGGWSWQITRDDGWPADFQLVVRVQTFNLYLPTSTTTGSYTVTNPADPSIVFDPLSGASFPYDTATPVAVEVTDPDGVSHVRIFVLGATRAELVYDAAPGGSALPGFTVMQSIIANGRRYEVERVDGWLEDFALVVVATNVHGGTYTEPATYTLTTLPSPGDAVPPVTSNPQPPPGTPISATTPVSIDVTDDTGLFRRVLVAVELDGQTEIAWDGDAWLGHYAGGGSERTPIAGGFRFTVLRDGGWPSSPTLRVFAFDQGGNEV